MKTALVVMLSGVDRPGIVESVADVVHAHGGNWEGSRFALLAGRFAGVLCVSVGAARAAELTEALQAMASTGLTVVVQAEAGDGTQGTSARRTVHLHLQASDRHGILRQVSHALTHLGVNLEDVTTERSSAPMAGGFVFEVQARLSCPAELDLDALRGALEALADDLVVELRG